MKVVYKQWKDGEGLEDIQAEIYTGASGLPAQGWQIKARNMQRGPDLTRYALTEDGKPLAYVTSNTDLDRKGRALIGYPWSLDDCPEDAKKKIFDEQLAYLEKKEDIEEIITGVVLNSKIKDKQIEWFQERGFVEEEKYYRYVEDIDVEKATAVKVKGKATKLASRVATEKDIDILIEVCLADENVREAFADEDGFRSYFKDRVFAVQPPVMLFDGDTIVAATAPLRVEANDSSVLGEGERIIMRFQAFRDGYDYAWDRLLVELAKHCKNVGWADIPIQTGFGFRASGPQADALTRMKPEFHEYELFLIKRK
jgi:hypothetical protein